MNLEITPRVLQGSVFVPTSKSTLHRALICAALAEGTSIIRRVTYSRDIEATLQCLEALGAKVRRESDCLYITGGRPDTKSSVEAPLLLPCGESGSTLRFLLPIAAALGAFCRIEGEGRLAERPLGPYLHLLPEHGVFCEPLQSDAVLPLHCRGQLQAGSYRLPGNISSQFVSGLLFALPLLEENSVLQITSRLESADYVILTIDALRRAGITVSWEETEEGLCYTIPGGQRYQAFDYEGEGDYSQAAFWMVANALGSQVDLEGLLPDSHQGDSAVVPILQTSGPLHLDVSNIPDLVPILAVYAAFQDGESHLYNAARLRLKESDRLYTTRSALQAVGAAIWEEGDSLVISGKKVLPGGVSSAFRDHRIAMALAIASTRCSGKVTIEGAECVNKSYPAFWEDFRRCGGEWEERT